MASKDDLPETSVFSRVEPFHFTLQELKRLHHRISLTLQQVQQRQFREGKKVFLSLPSVRKWPIELEDGQFLNTGMSRGMWDMLKAVERGRVNDSLPLRILEEVYQTAWVAYYNAKPLGRTDKEAKASAVIWAQLPLEKYVIDEVWVSDDE